MQYLSHASYLPSFSGHPRFSLFYGMLFDTDRKESQRHPADSMLLFGIDGADL